MSSVEKALALLGLLERNTRVRVVDVSRELAVAPSTAHRLLAAFERHGYVEQEVQSTMYAIGPQLAQLASRIARQLDLATLIRPFLAKLVAEIDETAHVSVLRGDKTYFLECVECSHGIRAVSRKGRSIFAYATASGKALLAERSAAEIALLYPTDELPRITRKTIATRTGLLSELRRTRERGYAMNFSESELDYAAYAGVVRDAAGIARAAIVVAGPASRIKRVNEARVVAALRAACLEASGALG
jgi:IclR family acetate operon transcriptional repressor